MFEATLGGKDRLVSVLTGVEGWKLVVIIDTDEIFAESRAIVLKIVGVGTVIAIIHVVCAWFISRTIANPIDLLVRASGDIARLQILFFYRIKILSQSISILQFHISRVALF